jgi:RNA polymerase sigma factor (sigma-70 family)
VIRNWARVQAAHQHRAYFRRLLVHEYLAGRRGLKNTLQFHGVDTIEHATTDSAFGRVDAGDQVARLLVGLPARQQAALALRFLEDCTYSEVAGALGCRESTARSLVKRGLAALRLNLDAQPTPTRTARTRRDDHRDD